MVGEKVICPLRGVMSCVGPVTFWLTTGWPGAILPPLFWQLYVAATELAVRKACVGPFPSPAALPLQVRPLVSDLVQDGVPTKCGLWAWAAVPDRMKASSIAGSAKMK